jgi:hypothetical protein
MKPFETLALNNPMEVPLVVLEVPWDAVEVEEDKYNVNLYFTL